MNVKITKPYRDKLLKMSFTETDIGMVIEVEDERGRQLITAGVAEETEEKVTEKTEESEKKNYPNMYKGG